MNKKRSSLFSVESSRVEVGCESFLVLHVFDFLPEIEAPKSPLTLSALRVAAQLSFRFFCWCPRPKTSVGGLTFSPVFRKYAGGERDAFTAVPTFRTVGGQWDF